MAIPPTKSCRSGTCARTLFATSKSARRPAAIPVLHTAAALWASAARAAFLAGLSRRLGWSFFLFFRSIELLFLDALLIKVQLDAVIEMSLLQHLA